MQMFFLKNMVSVSIAALLYSAISLGTLAEQEPEATTEPIADENLPTNELAKLNGESDTSIYQEMLDEETNPVEMPEGTPERRVQERLKILNDLEGMDEQNPPDLPATPSQDEMLPPTSENEVVPSMPEPQAVTPAPESEAGVPAPVTEAAVPELQAATPPSAAGTGSKPEEAVPAPEAMPAPEAGDLAAEDLTLAPEASLDSQNEAIPADVADENVIAPTHSTLNAKIIRPKYVVAPQAWDDEESRPVPKKEDPSSPESEGQGPHGKHKGGPQMAKSKVRIIKMGEDVPQDSGFTILNPW